jgi:hypothetical protein
MSLAFAAITTAANEISETPVEKLIDDLTQIDAPAPGLHGTADVLGFIAEDKPLHFGGGVLGSPAPKTPPEMRELARRGVQVLSQLITHLDDKRPTKLTIGGDFFMFRYFSDEYDPKSPPKTKPVFTRGSFEKTFDGGYTVKVGDACYSLIGQIVGRNLFPVRYQPSAGLVINSPIEAPVLIERVKNDWSGLSIDAHKASLITDAQSGTHPWTYGPALVRLRFYYPDDYKRLRMGELKEKIAEFEIFEKNP